MADVSKVLNQVKHKAPPPRKILAWMSSTYRHHFCSFGPTRFTYLHVSKDGASAGEQPNPYLNITRLVLQTNHVVLFPKLVSELRPAVAYPYTHDSTQSTPAVLTESEKLVVSFHLFQSSHDDTTWYDEQPDFLGSPSVLNRKPCL